MTENAEPRQFYHEKPVYPPKKKVDFCEEVGGYQNRDPYVWLEELRGSETVAWVAEQNRFTDSYFNDDQVRRRVEELKLGYLQCDYALPKTQKGRSTPFGQMRRVTPPLSSWMRTGRNSGRWARS